MRYFITLSYDGAAYCGWQRQPDASTVQQSLEKALSTQLREELEVVGARRMHDSMLWNANIPIISHSARILSDDFQHGSIMCRWMSRR